MVNKYAYVIPSHDLHYIVTIPVNFRDIPILVFNGTDYPTLV